MVQIKLRKLAVFILIFIFLIDGCAVRTASGAYKNKYVIDVYYNPGEMSIFGSQKLYYKNTEDKALEELYFHLYPNAFRSEDTAPMMGGVEDNYPAGFNPGQIDIIGVWVDGERVIWSTEDTGDTILRVSIGRRLETGEKAEIRVDFQEKIPYGRTDFGSYGGIACFENWYPILCIYDSSGWHTEPVCRIGEANFSEVSDYEVRLDLPGGEQVAHTGECKGVRGRGSDRKVITIAAEDVRDFTWISSGGFRKLEAQHNGIVIKSYFLDNDKDMGALALDTCARAIDFYSERFGKYPYGAFSVVETPLYGGAMEYPMLASVGSDYYSGRGRERLESAVAHEVAHQWWYAVVGNNEYSQPWLDEALSTYAEGLYLEKYYGGYALRNRLDISGTSRYKNRPGSGMDKFKSTDEYNGVVYIRGANILNGLRENVGDEAFYSVLKRYYETYKFKNADIADFLDVVRDVCGEQAAEFIKLRL